MRTLVTGGAGYIGSIVAAQLVAAGHHVVVLDDLSTGHADAVPAGAELVVGDIADPAVVRRLLEGGQGGAGAVDAVLHFAGSSLVAESVAEPDKYFRNNVEGSRALLEAMIAAGTPELVFSSSAAVYGEPAAVPIDESAATNPTNPYGESKLAVDELIGEYSRRHRLAATSLRYFNVAGADGVRGERHERETHLIPLVLRAAGAEPGSGSAVAVYGTDYPTPDGTAIRDYVHVLDLARAHLLALGGPAGEHRILNLGSGSGFSVREVIRVCSEVTGLPIDTLDAPRRAGDPARLVASSTLIGDTLGWSAELGLPEMVRSAWEFELSRPN